MKLIQIVAVLLSIGTSSIGAAAAVSVTVFKDVRIVDGSGGAALEHATLVISGEHILAVGANVTTPAGARVIDLAGKTAIPGLISDHSHLGIVDGVSANGANATARNIVRQARQYEVFGVTTVTSLGLNRSSFYDVQAELHGDAEHGADIFGADRGFGVQGAAPPASMGILDDQVYRPSSITEVENDMRDTAARHPILVKLWLDDFHGAMPPKMDPAIYRAIIDQAHRLGLRVAAHVFYLDDAKRLVADGIDVLAHGVRDQTVDAEFITAMKTHHVWYIPTLGLDESFYRYAEHPELLHEPLLLHALQPALAQQMNAPQWRMKIMNDAKSLAVNREALRINLLNVKSLFDAGVAIGFGTDSGATPLRIPGFAEHRELALLVQSGLTPSQAIKVATSDAAQLLHLDDRGSIAPGKLADLVILDGDPTADIGATDRIVGVWRGGKLVSAAVTDFDP